MNYHQIPFSEEVFEPYRELRQMVDGREGEQIPDYLIREEPNELNQFIEGVLRIYQLKWAPATVEGREVKHGGAFNSLMGALDQDISGEEELKQFLNNDLF